MILNGFEIDWNLIAERVGFEPTLPFSKHAFQACSFGHSDISPKKKKAKKWINHSECKVMLGSIRKTVKFWLNSHFFSDFTSIMVLYQVSLKNKCMDSSFFFWKTCMEIVKSFNFATSSFINKP